MLKLPNEIIACIMELVLDIHAADLFVSTEHDVDPSYPAMLSALLRVSRRIRGIALNTPTLWTIILMGFQGFPYGLFLERSRDVPLTVLWLANGKYKDEETIWHHHRRWRCLIVTSANSFTRSCRFPGESLAFPALEMLSICAKESVIRLCSLSRMPVLKQLKFDGLVKPSRLALLCEILADCKVLRHLTLDIYDGMDPDASYSNISLPSLFSFELRIQNNRHIWTGTVLHLFRAPNLRKLCISICTPFKAIPADNLFDNLKFGERVQSLELCVSHARFPPFSIPFRSMARQFPNVSELTIRCDISSTTEQLRECQLPNLLHFLAFWESGESGESDPLQEEDTWDNFVGNMCAFLENREMYFDEQGSGYVPLRLTIGNSTNYHEGFEEAVADGLVILESCSSTK